MNQTEYEQLLKLEHEGKALIGIDRIYARRFYTDLPISEIEKQTGERPYLEKILTWFGFLGSPAALILSAIISIIAFKWWALIAIPVFVIIWATFAASSPLGSSRMIFISLVLVAAICIYFTNYFGKLQTGAVLAFVFSLWCHRFLYYSATYFLRLFALRNIRAFNFIEDQIMIRTLVD